MSGHRPIHVVATGRRSVGLRQVQTERLDLRKHAEQRGAVLEHTGEYGVAALQLRHHRGKGGEGGCSEPAPYPDRVQAQRHDHATILQPDPVTRRHRNTVIMHTPAPTLATASGAITGIRR